jgi:hypothetical protein
MIVQYSDILRPFSHPLNPYAPDKQARMKIKALSATILIIGVLVFWKFNYISQAPELLTAFSSKMGCSLRYVSKYTDEQVLSDLSNYSPLINLVDLQFDVENKSVTSQFLWEERTSRYGEFNGCVIDSQRTSPLVIKGIKKRNTAPVALATKISPSVQALTEALVDSDNRLNLDTRAVVILKDGKVIAEEYTEGYTSNTLFLGWSMAKTLNAIIVGNMIKNGIIDYNSRNLLSLPHGDSRQEISLENLLTMTSGLHFKEEYGPGGDAVKMLFSDDSTFELPSKSKLLHRPGSFFSIP